MSAPKLVEPYGCGRCGIPLPHGQQTGPGGLHGWERPSQEQMLSRMKARRLARVVAREGALPMPSGPEPRDVEDELTGANLSLWEEEQATARLRWALASAQRGRRVLRARVAELEAERHSTNESLDDAAKALRADRDRIAELEQVIADAPASYALMDRAAAVADRLTRTFAPTQALREGEHYAATHHDYRPGLGRDLPGTGGVE